MKNINYDIFPHITSLACYRVFEVLLPQTVGLPHEPIQGLVVIQLSCVAVNIIIYPGVIKRVGYLVS